MRIVLLSVDDEFAGSMQKYLYERHPEWVVGSVISACAIYKKSKLGAMLFVIRRSGLRYGAEMFRMKIIRKFMNSENKITPSELARRQNVEMYYSKNINDPPSLAKLKAWSPDLIISTNFSHYVGDRVRSIGRAGAWNLHKSYLPHYRGIAPSFYALLNGEKRVGVTLHQIAKGFDTGDIIRQTELPIASDDSVYTLNQKTSDAGGRMMAQVLEETEQKWPVPTAQPAGDWPNYSYPTRAHIQAFREKGLHF
jgi:folate-dependent phosphoribosylglycinamide formyltransferase PurN